MRYKGYRGLRNIYIHSPYRLRSRIWKYRRKGGGGLSYRYRVPSHLQQPYSPVDESPRKEVVHRYEINRLKQEEVYKQPVEPEQVDEELIRLLKEHHLDERALRELLEKEAESKQEPEAERFSSEDEESIEQIEAPANTEEISSESEKVAIEDLQVERENTPEFKEDAGVLDKVDIEPLIDEIEGKSEFGEKGEVSLDAGELTEPLVQVEEQSIDELEVNDISSLENGLFPRVLEPEEFLAEPMESDEKEMGY